MSAVSGGPDAHADVGRGIIAASWAGTAAFCVVAVGAAVFRQQLHLVAVAVSVVLFLVGCVTFLWAFAIAVERSRTDAIGIGGLFFLQGSAPRAVRRHLLGALAVQVVVAVATAAARPFTDQAFVILAPLYGLGLCGLWAARYGTFGPRTGADDVQGPP